MRSSVEIHLQRQHVENAIATDVGLLHQLRNTTNTTRCHHVGENSGNICTLATQAPGLCQVLLVQH